MNKIENRQNTIDRNFLSGYNGLELSLKYNDLENTISILRRIIANQLFLNKGNFNWVSLTESEFKSFVADNTKKSLEDNAKINCWEQVLYSLYKANIIPKKSLQKIYSVSYREICDNLESILTTRMLKVLRTNMSKQSLLDNLTDS